MIKIEKFSSDFVVLDAGSIITFSENSPCRFSISINSEESINVVICFEDNDTGQKDLFRTFDEKTNSVKLICTNFNNPMGSGTAETIKLFTYKDKAIFINFWVFLLGNTNLKRVDYCFFKEP